MFCPRCGQESADHLKFCANCGFPLQVAAGASRSQGAYGRQPGYGNGAQQGYGYAANQGQAGRGFATYGGVHLTFTVLQGGRTLVDMDLTELGKGYITFGTESDNDIVIKDASTVPFGFASSAGYAATNGLVSDPYNLAINALRLQGSCYLAEGSKSVAVLARRTVNQ